VTIWELGRNVAQFVAFKFASRQVVSRIIH
jgi:hypothetical protein